MPNYCTYFFSDLKNKLLLLLNNEMNKPLKRKKNESNIFVTHYQFLNKCKKKLSCKPLLHVPFLKINII